MSIQEQTKTIETIRMRKRKHRILIYCGDVTCIIMSAYGLCLLMRNFWWSWWNGKILFVEANHCAYTYMWCSKQHKHFVAPSTSSKNKKINISITITVTAETFFDVFIHSISVWYSKYAVNVAMPCRISNKKMKEIFGFFYIFLFLRV